MGAPLEGFVVRWNATEKRLSGFKIEEGDGIEDVSSLMLATGFDPDAVVALSQGVKKGKTVKSRSTDAYAPLLTMTEVIKVAALAASPRCGQFFSL